MMELIAVLTHAEESGFVALNPETGAATQGETVEEAVANLKEATALHLADYPLSTIKVGTLAGVLRQAEVSPEKFLQALRG